MSILSGFFKTKRYRKTTDGYKLESNWTSGNTVELDDGNTVQNNLGAIKGITTSMSVKEEGYAADLAIVNPTQRTLVTKDLIASSCKWSPFENHSFSSAVVHTIVNGNLVVENGKLVSEEKGQALEFDR